MSKPGPGVVTLRGETRLAKQTAGAASGRLPRGIQGRRNPLGTYFFTTNTFASAESLPRNTTTL